MTNNKRSKNFEGEYINKEGQRKKVKVKVFSILSTMVLSLTLIKAGHVIYTVIEGIRTSNPETPEELALKHPDIELIKKFLKDNPNLIKNITKFDYRVKMGDQAGSLAEKCGITIERLGELNPNSNMNCLYEGEVLTLEEVKPLDELDESITLIEKYFTDYVFKSSAADIARGEKREIKQQQELYKAILFGNVYKDGSVEPNSIYGKFLNVYLKYRDNNGIVNQLKKEEYLSELNGVYQELIEKNDIFNFVDLDLFTVYCKNGNTKTIELQDNNKTIYDRKTF